MTVTRVVLLHLATGMTLLNHIADAAPPGAAEAEVVAGNNAFAFDLYAALRDRPGNLFLSPHSISTALAMTYAGARGDTAEEMARVLHFKLGQSRLHAAFAEQVKRLETYQEDGRRQVTVANALWADHKAALLPTYVDLVKRHYDGTCRNLDLGRAVEASRIINQWVEEKTHGKIKKLLQPEALANAFLVLTNAIHFKGTWQFQFKEEDTRDAPFLVGADQRVTVPMMHRKAEFNVGSAAGVELLELPYTGDHLSMVVLLPRRVDGLPELERGLTAELLDDWLSRLRKREIDVYLPKFEMKTEYMLGGTLRGMGMRKPFAASADFTGMSESGGLISEVIHKAYVNVDEEGTEAAAATGVVMITTSIEPTPTFRADHPFLFLIRDRVSGSILFMGRVVDPTA